jgi:hypothetical protein
MSPLIMKRPKRDKTLTRKPKSKDELLFNAFPSLVDVELGVDEDIDESEDCCEFVGDADMILSTTRPERGGHSQGQRIHK